MKKAEKIISEMLEEYRTFNPVNAMSQTGMKKTKAYPFYVKMVKQAQKEAYKEGFEKGKNSKQKKQ
jgi:hypothetical protein